MIYNYLYMTVLQIIFEIKAWMNNCVLQKHWICMHLYQLNHVSKEAPDGRL